MNCRLCGRKGLQSLYSVSGIPIFQNRVYPSLTTALNAPLGTVKLVRCSSCGFIFNAAFDPALLEYDECYQNEQACSPAFEQHLDEVVSLLEKRGITGKRIVEIGCGKGTFLKKLWLKGHEAFGVDPAYEGTDSRVVRGVFGAEHAAFGGEVFILRHVLEHIAEPLDFLHDIAKNVNYQGKIFIEIPNFDWIIEQRAFWDIFYEHCNYFCPETLNGLFHHAEWGTFFQGQYLFVWADLKDLKSAAEYSSCLVKTPLEDLAAPLRKSRKQASARIKEYAPILVWGAAAKGSTIVNLLDKNRELIPYLVDINPRKQNGWIGGSGHPILSPSVLADEDQSKNILVVNGNYFEEICATVDDSKFTCYSLEEKPKSSGSQNE